MTKAVAGQALLKCSRIPWNTMILYVKNYTGFPWKVETPWWISFIRARRRVH